MKFEFEKLGLLDKATLELADLTIICGENNTGKTYATYAVYGFLRSWRRLLESVLEREIEDIAKAESAYKFDLHEMFHDKVNNYLAKLGKEYIRRLPQVFATNKSYFDGVGFLPSIEAELDFTDAKFQRTIGGGPAGKVFATLSKEPGSHVLELLIADHIWVRSRFSGLGQFVADAIADIVFSPFLPDTHISSAERTGAAIFRKELDMARNRMFKALSTIDSKDLKKNPFQLFKEMEAGYALPVEDNVEFVRHLEDIDKQTGKLASEAPALLVAFDAIIGGSYKVIKNQGLIFQPQGSEQSRFSMNESSSCIRALLDVGFYLRCKAKSGDIFIIDEPELNLHPKNQRAFARLVARMVNAGLRVFITTHSDYLIKEFNTLIMLAQKTPHTRKMQKNHGYANEELLNPQRVRLYMTGTEIKPASVKGERTTRINTLKPATIYPDRGIDVETFDTTIEEMNTIQSEILYGGDI
ncbi:ATP-binding protein [Verminephrobacter eiseniae]|uniref:ATP-binding protein n=1 Tax=Verminephrobacter eiseniae TaxID=364317 RepID=UPI002237E451|nr:ATP-binding protein [Verminephrobacter eiseniae]MCW5235478.1 ATP-binding protein [Verminephrobacter eiseniae]